jgi:ribosomal protein L29
MNDKQLLDAIDDLRGSIEGRAEAATGKVERATGLIDRIKDNIAYILGLPAAITGAFGFMLDSGNDEAALAYQVAQLEEAVADLKAEGDLLGGAKNFTLDLSGAPGGSLTPILVGAALLLVLVALFWYQARRKR